MAKKKLTEAEIDALTTQRTTEYRCGPTPSGGAYMIGHFFDKNMFPCPKRDAKYAQLIEYDKDGNVIHEYRGDFDINE
ncbi:MAG: hypothetical protein Q4F69_10615 [Bacteroidia bacterium]|nr:hypothetical protein [Bacteroidia bacterium]